MAKCSGCGIKLQFIDEAKPGYVDAGIYSQMGEEVLCKRCYEIKNRGLKYDASIFKKEYYNIISKAKDQANFLILIIDLNNYQFGFIPKLGLIFKDVPTLIIGTKKDVIPKDMKINYLKQTLMMMAKQNGLSPVKCYLVDNDKKEDILQVANFLNKIRGNISAYCVGVASAGKSSFLNSYNKFVLNKKPIFTTSYQLQTTLGIMRLYVSPTLSLYDTPGYLDEESFTTLLSAASFKMITHNNFMRPKVFQLNGGQTLFLGGLARVDFESDTKIFVSCYVANGLNVHRTKTLNADSFYEKHRCDLLIPPSNDENINLDKTTFFKGADTYNLYINGLGYLHIRGEKYTLRVSLPKVISSLFIKE